MPPLLTIPPVVIVSNPDPSLFILEAATVLVVIAPVNVVAPLVLGIHIDPLPPIPVPSICIVSGIEKPVPSIFKAVPLATVVLFAPAPHAFAFFILITPVVNVVTPV